MMCLPCLKPSLGTPRTPSTNKRDDSGRGHKLDTLKGTEIREKYGLFLLNSNEADCSIDIIAIHGLNGDWEETWTDTNGLLWLRDFLPLQLPEARIMSFGYNATSAFTNSINDIEDVAAMLLDRLDGKRQRAEQKKRPLIFISHSLGGIIVKKALILAHERSAYYGDLLTSVQGLVFFGVPHRGADAAYWSQFAARLLRTLQLGSGTNPNFLDGLTRNSRTLADISTQFIERAQNLQIRTFYETETLFSQLVVDRDSARLNLPNEVPVGIDGADHISLCKFSSMNGEKYAQVASAIKKLVQSGLGTPAISLPAGKACFLLPFEQDRKFVGREDIIESIANRFQTQRRVALTGLGGVGKSQIAIEYCYRYHERYPNGHVFWMYADDFPRIRDAYRKIAQALELPGWDTQDFDVFQRVSAALSHEIHRWLLVIDNADDRDLFFEHPSNIKIGCHGSRLRLADFLPRSTNGSTLIITRDRVAGQRLTDEKVINIEPMTESDAKELLQLKAPQQHGLDQAMSDELLRILECLPLAITQAAAFMGETNTSVEEYLQMLRKDSNLEQLLSEDRPDLRRDANSLNSVIRTWRVSFERIRDRWHRAAELLSLIVMLDRQCIPKSLLQEEGESPVSFREALATLEAFSLIVVEEGGASLGVHRLVQISTQLWLQVCEETGKWQEKALRVLAQAFPTQADKYENWGQCQPLYSHAQVVIQYGLTSKSDYSNLDSSYANLLQNLASYDLGQGQYDLAYERSSKAYFLREQAVGPEHLDTLKSMYYVAIMLRIQGKFNESETKQRHVKELLKRILGSEHPETLASMNELGNTFQSQGQYQDAEKLHREILEIRQKVLGIKHTDTWKSMNNLAIAFQGQNKYQEAEKIHRQSLEICRESLGPEHPHTWISMNNLALTLRGRGKYKEVEDLYRQSLEIGQKVLGPKHPHMLISMANLASVFRDQGKYQEAKELCHQIFEIQEKILGPEHPDTLQTMKIIADMPRDQGMCQGAEELHYEPFLASASPLVYTIGYTTPIQRCQIL